MASKMESEEKFNCLKDATAAARHAAKVLDKLEPKIARKSEKTTSKELPDCLKQFNENVKILQDAIPKIIQFHEAEHGDIECETFGYQFKRKGSFRVSKRRVAEKRSSYQETKENDNAANYLETEKDTIRQNKTKLQETHTTKIRELEDIIQRNTEEHEKSVKRLKMDMDSMKRETKHLQKKLETKEKELEDSSKRNRKQNERETQGLKKQVSDLQRQLEVERIAKNEAKAELDDALTSAVISSKPSDKNPNVAEVSDQTRPSQIAEELSALYDSEWADSYEVLEDNMNDKECCTALLNILLAVYEGCKELSTVGFYERVQQSIESPVQSSDETHALEAINKIVAPKIRAEKQETEEMKAYLKKCTDICGLMVVQDPPLVFTCGSRDKFDTAVFRSYTKRGSHVEFVVWPALLVNEAGSMLSKGIAQGCEEKKRPLSAVTSSKLPDKNPNVADVSDQTRPSKIAEELSELYDYEWTNAYEVLEDNMNDKECCTALLNILLAVYKECNELSTVGFYERVQQSIESPVQSPVETSIEVQMSDYMKQQIKVIRKTRAMYALEAINKIVAPKIRAEKQETEEMKAYLKKCTDICWLMVVQDPPLVFTCGSRDKFDTAVFRSYTKRGSHVEFVVWPALLVNEAGSMLSKGIAQGYVEKKRPH